ncbi:hypothetical protein C4J95_4247 [Pseudomonas orientalis]|nr:hypothetical protein C4J98_4218 [Pseudomonas orientalis]AZE91032.1 hypothetical protein C4J97_4360 [Pseudomonas orientalis]AZE96313.1 hypothetical protein C4J96_4225 [Pseudomonas orientalis]AZF01681.1 hypothetical protein C4J95_4247 [Pseudomonas orientalis]
MLHRSAEATFHRHAIGAGATLKRRGSITRGGGRYTRLWSNCRRHDSLCASLLIEPLYA